MVCTDKCNAEDDNGVKDPTDPLEEGMSVCITYSNVVENNRIWKWFFVG